MVLEERPPYDLTTLHPYWHATTLVVSKVGVRPKPLIHKYLRLATLFNRNTSLRTLIR